MSLPLRLAHATLLVASLLLGARPVLAGAFFVTDVNTPGGVYELRYYVGSNRLFENGISTVLGPTPLTQLLLTNSGSSGGAAWETVTSQGFHFLQAPAGFGTSAAATLGWDLSGVTGGVAKVELLSDHHLFQFFPHNLKSLGDSIFADVATPSSFGAGPYTNLYTHVSDNASRTGPDFVATVGTIDITACLPATWLAAPDLLELRFGYELLDTDIPNIHLQLFREGGSTFPADDGFMLRITLDSAAVDADADGLRDGQDNCVDVPNPNQEDTDGDLIGNACDCDFDQDGFCSIADFNVFLPAFQSTADPGNGTDMDGSGAVGIGDFNLFLPGFQAGAPGPSGLICPWS